jgi:glutamyl-tRNA synthetase
MFWIGKRDMNSVTVGKFIRLMELFNIKIEKANADSLEAAFASEAYEEAREAEAKLIHWIPKGEEFTCQVVMPDASLQEGIAESACKKLKPNDIIQFERFGFVRVDKTGLKLTAYYAHK